MLKVRIIFGILLIVGGALAAITRDADLPPTAQGTFVQRKYLADVEVTLVSTGTFVFEKGKCFEWHTIKPLPSTFIATPTNYTFVVNGKTTSHPLQNDVTSVAKIFEIKEVKSFVKQVLTEPAQGFPTTVKVIFKNGDTLDIQMKCQ